MFAVRSFAEAFGVRYCLEVFASMRSLFAVRFVI